MKIFTVSFFGHRYLDDTIHAERALEKLIRKMLLEKEYVEFLVGRDGDFDILVASVIRRMKRTVRSDNSALIWVLPYETADYRENREAYEEYFDSIEVCNSSAGIHPKAAFQERNRSMVSRSDFCIFCIDHNSGGAWQTLRYAKSQGVPYLNILLPELV